MGETGSKVPRERLDRFRQMTEWWEFYYSKAVEKAMRIAYYGYFDFSTDEGERELKKRIALWERLRRDNCEDAYPLSVHDPVIMGKIEEELNLKR